MQNRFVFIVEGDCEVDFVNNKLLPYLYSLPKVIERGWVFNAQKITTNRKKNIKGGNVGFEYLRNEVNRVSAQSNPWITTFLDFFRLPNDFPGFSADACNIELIEKAMAYELNVPFFIPYIQKYEYETLLFVDVDAFSSVVDEESQLQCIADTIQSYSNAEEINGGLETAPSKRLNHIFGYEKVHDSHLIMENLTIEQICTHCPRFKNWLKHIETIIDG
ncbi:MAG: DUF4276 family protein [Bacteroidaceae bacterium]|nr:DUF4276 family protein [Bacteroidaceae bacterium]